MRPVTKLFPLPFPPDDTCPIPAYFDSFAPPAPATEKLEGDRQADVVVVGGGYTGLSTAVHLAERGIRPLVLEARDIGWGESSRSFGQVVPYLKHSPDHLARSSALMLQTASWRRRAEVPTSVFSLIEKYRIDCSAVRRGLIFGAHSPAGMRTLETRTMFWQKRWGAGRHVRRPGDRSAHRQPLLPGLLTRSSWRDHQSARLRCAASPGRRSNPGRRYVPTPQ
jgi:glycine/D-amino acid oxidase-like deaminating enzyme